MTNTRPDLLIPGVWQPPAMPTDDGIPLDLFVDIIRAPIETKPSAKNHAIAVAQQFLLDLGYEVTEPGTIPITPVLSGAPMTLAEVRLPNDMVFRRLRVIEPTTAPLRNPADIKRSLAQQLIRELMNLDIDMTCAPVDGGIAYAMEVHVVIPDPIPF